MSMILSALAAILIHELAHATTAMLLGVRITRVGCDWRGVYIARECGKPWQNAIISLAGPLANLATAYATLLVGHGWQLCLLSLGLGVYNLLPLAGSDGLRAARLLVNRRAA